jgi:hypothetical protein
VTKEEMLEVLQTMEDMARCDKDAGRVVEAARKEQMVNGLRQFIRQNMSKKPRGFQKGNKHAGKGFNS